MKVAIEIGGTFTDILLLSHDGQILEELKIPSTPEEPEVAVFSALQQLSKSHNEIETLAHGSTVATNAVLERKGSPTGMLVTRGFRDLMEIQRHDRKDVYDIRYQRSAPIVSRDRVLEINERVEAGGIMAEKVSEQDVVKAIEPLYNSGVKSLAVCFLHSYANSENESLVKKIIESRWPEIEVTLSSEILPEFREYERASTTCLSAYVMPIVNRYLLSIEGSMGNYGCKELWMMQSNGGALPASMARKHGVRTILSGPAAGVTGAYSLANSAGFPRIITFDMGGTSVDISLVTDGQPEITTDSEIDRLPIKIPMLDIISIGAGGGSIVWLDSKGMLHVGPESQGANPGPACYLRGGNLPTVTDANVFLGFIRPDNFLGGRMTLGQEEAESVIKKLAARMGKEPRWVAEGILRVVNTNMALATKLMSTERGYDARHYTLVAFGGAGPLHGVYIAQELGIKTILVPQYPGLLSAYGLLLADFKKNYVISRFSRLDQIEISMLRRMFDELEARAHDELHSYHFDKDFGLLSTRFFLDIRYKGQAYELTIPFDFSELEAEGLILLKRRFNEMHHKKYGHSDENQTIEIVNYRLDLVVPQQKPLYKMAREDILPHVEKRQLYLFGTETECGFYLRETLPVGYRIPGPAVVEEHTSTTLILQGWTGYIDSVGNIVIRKGS